MISNSSSGEPQDEREPRDAEQSPVGCLVRRRAAVGVAVVLVAAVGIPVVAVVVMVAVAVVIVVSVVPVPVIAYRPTVVRAELAGVAVSVLVGPESNQQGSGDDADRAADQEAGREAGEPLARPAEGTAGRRPSVASERP